MAKARRSKKTFVLSFGYWFGAHSLGLLLHPYQSVRRMHRERVYESLVWLPSVCLLIWWVFGLVVSRLDVLASMGLYFLVVPVDKLGITRVVLVFGFVWGGVFLLMWQGLLWYLWRRFRVLV